MPAVRLQSTAWWAVALTLFAFTLAVTTSGCGSAASNGPASTDPATTSAASHTAVTTGYSKRDGDSDSDDEHPPLHFGNDDGPLLARFGGRAAPADRRAITALVKGYYAASVAGNGERACSLLSPSIASGVAGEYGRTGHESCATAMSALLAAQHERFVADDVSTMLVTAVHVKGDLGLAVFSFKTEPESQIVLARESGLWRIDSVEGTYMP